MLLGKSSAVLPAVDQCPAAYLQVLELSVLFAWVDLVVSLGIVGNPWRADVTVLVRGQRENVMTPSHLPDLIFELSVGSASLRA